MTAPGTRTALYLRVSSEKQADNASLGVQEQTCREYAAQHGLEIDERHIYREIYSGRLDNLQMFLLKEFFEILEKAIDRCREAGVVAYEIVLKNS